LILQRIEEASLNSWPALQQILLDGWLLRFSNGYTKRANSVNPRYISSMDIDEKVAICEKLYAEKDLPTIFRFTSIYPIPDLDQLLEQRGYRKIDPTLVLHLELRDHTFEPTSSALLRCEQLDDWMDIFCQFSGSALEEHQMHKQLLQAIPSQRYLASLVVSGEVVACGLGVLDNAYFGIFDLVTDPMQRRRGFARQLILSMLNWAQKKGGLHAYLHVTSRNEAARGLYAKLGFRQAYHYWYRIRQSR
jgi:ribosomal protein S18 acetylase RimI-like enzyme